MCVLVTSDFLESSEPEVVEKRGENVAATKHGFDSVGRGLRQCFASRCPHLDVLYNDRTRGFSHIAPPEIGQHDVRWVGECLRRWKGVLMTHAPEGDELWK